MGTEALAPQPRPMAPVDDRLAEPYLDLCKRCLTRGSHRAPAPPKGTARRAAYTATATVLRRFGLKLVRPVDGSARELGLDFTDDGETMVGMARLDSLQACVVDILRNGVPGDLIETGVWRGGASILMRAVLYAYGITDRTVWLADSFEGLPKPDAVRYPADAGVDLSDVDVLAVPLEQVQANFAAYGLLDDQVRFLRGWFRDTLPTAPVERIAVLRLDGDLYESTMDALTALYHRVSPGGYVIVDDYGVIESCRKAVEDFRADRRITDEIQEIDWSGVYWQRTS